MLSTKRTRTNSNRIVASSSSYHHQSISSAEKIANNDDLLTGILLCLPVKSLLKFKSVSKHWLSLITNPNFSLQRTLIPSPISGLVVYRLYIREYDFIDLTSNPSRAPFKALTFLGERAIILQSCNGLLLCSSSRGNELTRNYYVYNPTTTHYTTLPPFHVNGVFRTVYGVNLAFNPSKSPDYEVICVRNSDSFEKEHNQIEIYSFKTGLWRKSGGTFTAPTDTHFSLGVFWNSSIHWISPWGSSSYFDVDEEKLHKMPMPDIPDGCRSRRFRYFGESRGHLHLVEIYGPCSALFDVYEMEKDYSGWMVRYRVDLLGVATAFPEMVRSYRNPLDFRYYGFSILSIEREEDDEDSYLVLHLPEKAIGYNFKHKSFKKLHEFAPVGTDIEPASLEYRWFYAFPFYESLANV